MHCTHCYSAGLRTIEEELSNEEIITIINSLNEIKVFELFFDGGESLLRPDFISICNHATNIGMSVSFSTNGLLMTKNVADKLKKAGIKRVQVSLDGATSFSHDAFRKTPRSFDKAISCIKTLVETEIYVTVACMISKYNCREFDKLIDLCINLGVQELILIRPIHSGNAKINNTLFLDKALLNKIYLDMIHKKIKLKDLLTIRINHNPLIIPLVEKLKINSKIKAHLIQDAVCSAGKTMCWISSTGDVTPCPLVHLKLGNIRETSFEEIWRKNKILIQLRNGKQSILRDCVKCKYLALCNGGCHADAYGTQNNLFAKDPICVL
jgi:radical SAM protein with 4Fe4S-binding SPASM domain